jgi:[glutamine synthetase] adenylyltransferase / [glutamine synthetase]-adenylyl-L-tyrosine phosphorylase
LNRPALPDSLALQGNRFLDQLDLTGLDAQQNAQLQWVLSLSDFASSAALRQRDWLADALADHGFTRAATAADIKAALDTALADVTELSGLQRGLRQVRQRFQLWLVWRHLTGDAALEETIAACSLQADLLIDAASQHLYQWMCSARGTPWGDDSNEPQQLVVLALGKLGGRELNLSSDVDLVFAYPETGVTRRADGSQGETNQQFFIRLGQQLIQALDPVTVDGFVFRVDMRLRPYGDSGPLAMDFARIEDYYTTQGRDWERYALMKARPCAGDVGAGKQLLRDLRPFVFRRYLDFGAIDSLREMKRKLIAERQHPDDVKLGPGGIRDIEFSVQMQQMIWGGRERELRASALLKVLPALVAHGHIDAAEATQLTDAYRFLRDTEHSLQAEADQQTQRLPGNETSRLKLALGRGYPDFTAFAQALDQHRAAVTEVFNSLLGDQQEPDTLSLRVWEAPDDLDVLLEAGFSQPQAAQSLLRSLQLARDRNSVSAEARSRLERLMPVLLDAVADTASPDLALERVVPVILAVLRRSAYLVLLRENPDALRRFVELVSTSLWLAQTLTEHPVFLDALLAEEGLCEVPSKEVLAMQLRERLGEVEDEERRLDCLREFKMHHVFDVALAEVRGTLSLMKVSDALTWLAEAILEVALEQAWHDNRERFPEYAQARGFVIVGYGKLGGLELGPGSDLDLVFLHDLAGSPGPFLQRLARRLLHILTAPTYHGTLYEIDTRLRPSGNAGTMVSSLSAFRDYQLKGAWVWEHQALVRARVVTGDAELAQRFTAMRQELLCQQRDLVELRSEVLKMRQRISETHSDEEDLKRGSGGIVDIEFMVQYLVLANAHEYPSLTEFTDNVRILEGVESLGLMPGEMATRLREAYIGLRSEWHRSVLDIPDRQRAASVLAEYRHDVRRAWQLVFETG